MVYFAVCAGWMTVNVKQAQFIQLQPRLAALAALQEDQADLLVGAVAHKAQTFGFQLHIGSAGAQVCELIRLMNKEKVAAEKAANQVY